MKKLILYLQFIQVRNGFPYNNSQLSPSHFFLHLENFPSLTGNPKHSLNLDLQCFSCEEDVLQGSITRN